MISKLRTRLTKLIEFLEEHDYPDLYVKKAQQEKGAPRTLICLRVRDEENNSSINNS